MASARETALRTLMACQRQGAWSDGYLKKAIREAGLDSRDAALCSRLCFGRNAGGVRSYIRDERDLAFSRDIHAFIQ